MTEKEIEKIFKKHKSEISPKARFETLLWAVREYEENTETQATESLVLEFMLDEEAQW